MNKIISSEITHKRVLFLAFPVVLSNATIPILGAVDTAVVGQMGLATPIGAVGIAAVILTAIFWLFGFLRMGISGLTAQALGEGNNIEANALLIRSLTIGISEIYGKVAADSSKIIKSPISNRDCICAKVLVENNLIKSVSVGDLIVECSQNEKCLKKFCFSCKQLIHYYQQNCYECKTSYENENPNLYNYYFNKDGGNNIKWGSDDNEYDIDETEYLYLNKEITVEISIKQILSTMTSIQNQIICSICKISLYKTEKCNGLSHHNLERCYSCSRIGYAIRGLDDHWSIGGVGGCFRFDNDSAVKKYVPEYLCDDSICSNHEIGDCMINEHQIGIQKLNMLRKRAYVYHMLKSLLSDIKFQVYDKLYDICKNDSVLLDFLPYKQTLILLNKFKKPGFYVDVGCHHPLRINNCHLLYKNKWRGLNVDLNKISIEIFNFVRRDDVNINMAVSLKKGKIKYYYNKLLGLSNSLLKKNLALCHHSKICGI